MAAKSIPGAPRVRAQRVVLALLLQGVLTTAAGVGLWYWSGRPVGALIAFAPIGIAWGLVFAATLIGAAAVLFRGFPKASDYLVRLQADTYRMLGPLGWPAIVTISLCAGISEEVALRAGLQTLLGDHLGPVAAIAIASAVFAALHMAKPLITALLFVIGVIFGMVYWATGSLLTVVIAHVLYDIWALRFLNQEMQRLGLFEDPEDATAAPLAIARGGG